MTRYWRNGFWRTSAQGVDHWVEGHWVERDDWDRGSIYSYLPYARECLSSFGALGSSTSRFANPNAKCPVCGEDVFFYQNEFGSRVYFDELGPPWPKHSCTDNLSYQIVKKVRGSKAVYPALRDRESISYLSDRFASASWDPEDEFRTKYGTKPWECWEIFRRIKGVGRTLLILSAVDEDKVMYLAAPRLPRIIKVGSIVFYKRLRLAYFDTSSMEPSEIEVERLSANEFIKTQFGFSAT